MHEPTLNVLGIAIVDHDLFLCFFRVYLKIGRGEGDLCHRLCALWM